ncbi:MAG: carbon-nitrogen hydrolase [Alphaproteobacteria bacterium]|nr:carbon-nitrogen hydrolase [Alphaproteobacteria bacterium]
MRVALYQTTPNRGSVADGLDRLAAAAGQAAAEGADILITPEMFLSGYNIGAEAVRARAEAADGPAARAAAEIARTNKIGLLYGYPELTTDGAVYNAIQLIGADGDMVSDYRKTHLFGAVDRAMFSAGTALARPVIYGGWRLAVAICYDIEFPELARALALAGAEAILVPTANMAPFVSIATRVVPSRAEENEVFVAYANYVGTEGEFDYVGLSCIAGPDGADLARAGVAEEMIFADFDRAHFESVRQVSTHLGDRRPDLYATSDSQLTDPGDGA